MAIRIKGNVIIPDVVGNNTTTGILSVGINAISSLTTGTHDVAIGLNALAANTIGSQNIAIGTNSLGAVTTGNNNIGIGYNSGNLIVDGSNNTVIGNVTLAASTNNTVLISAGPTERIKVDSSGLYINGEFFTGGAGQSGFSGRSGYSGFSGYSGAAGATGATGSTGVSGFSGYSGAAGATGSTGVSGFSGYSGAAGATGVSGFSGFSGTGISGFSGYSGSAGTGLTAGSSSIGYINYNGITKTAGQMDGGTTAPSSTNRLNYDGYFYATKFYGDGSQLSGLSAGVAINDDTSTNANRYLLWEDVTSGTSAAVGVSSTKLYFNPSTGTLYATQFTSLSDASKKSNVETISNAADIVNQMRGVSFDWIDTGLKAYGVIAQELESVVPEAVVESDGVKSVNYNMIIAFLIESNKELMARISALEGK